MNKKKQSITIFIRKNPYGDSRHAPKDTTYHQFHRANVCHIEDIRNVLDFLARKLSNNADNHDHTKLEYEKEFFDNFKDSLLNGKDFVSNTWYQKHIREERHHPTSYCHDDINLLDILEMIVDCVCAGKTRSGEVRPMEINDEILKKAFANTVKLVDEITEVVEDDKDN